MSYSAVVAADSPYNYWRFGEASGNPQDVAPTPHLHLTSYSGLTYGQPGALFGDSNKSFLLAAATPSFVGSTSGSGSVNGDTFTVEAWVKYVSSISGKTFSIFSRGLNGIYLALTDSSGAKVQIGKGSVSVIATGSVSLAVDSWYHVCWTKNGAENKLYVNGVECAGAVTNATIASSQGLGIGCHGNNPTSVRDSAFYFDGYIDEVAVYSTALSAAQVLAHYQEGAGPAAISGRVAPIVASRRSSRRFSVR